MAGTSVFFNNFQASQEQDLLESLIIESISIYGQDMYYVPRKLNTYDDVYGEDDTSSYELAILLPIYIENVDGFQGDGSFLSKFGLEIRDQVKFSMAIKTFNEEVGIVTDQTRPNEGDLIYFPLNKKCFQIKFVEKFEMYYPLGKLYLWQVTAELFEYSNERISTGIVEIDSLQKQFDLNMLDWAIRDEFGDPILTEDSDYLVLENSTVSDLIPYEDSEELQEEFDQIAVWTIQDPFSEGAV